MDDRRKILDLFDDQEVFWKQRAADGIERYRKGDGRITLTDENGNPISNAKIKESTTARITGTRMKMININAYGNTNK